MTTTYRSSLVERLYELADSTDTVVICIYCHHDERERHTPEGLVASILKQLIIHAIRPLSDDVQKLYNSNSERKTQPDFREIIATLQSEVRRYKAIYVIIDGLDECNERTLWKLVRELYSLPNHVRLAFTSRPHVVLPGHLKDLLEMHVEAQNNDVEIFLRTQIDDSPRLASILKLSTDLKDEIIATIQNRIKGM